jgi:hypothetical protein
MASAQPSAKGALAGIIDFAEELSDGAIMRHNNGWRPVIAPKLCLRRRRGRARQLPAAEFVV